MGCPNLLGQEQREGFLGRKGRCQARERKEEMRREETEVEDKEQEQLKSHYLNHQPLLSLQISPQTSAGLRTL